MIVSNCSGNRALQARLAQQFCRVVSLAQVQPETQEFPSRGKETVIDENHRFAAQIRSGASPALMSSPRTVWWDATGGWSNGRSPGSTASGA
jgi:hypothetical protein